MDVTGTLKVKGESQNVSKDSSKSFMKREFVITDNSSQYPQHISFQLTQDKCSLIDSYQIGAEIKVHFNLRGREWINPQGEAKYFNSVEAWRIEGASNAGSNSGASTAAASANSDVPSETFTSKTPDDDLPF
jgi:hypothetical protein